MDEYVEQFVEDTKKKIGVKRRLPKVQYDAYWDVVCHPYHLAESEEDALLVLDCIEDTFKRRWYLYHKQEDATLAGQAAMVASAFRSAETMQTEVDPHKQLGGRR